jgi:hypothetical protein
MFRTERHRARVTRRDVSARVAPTMPRVRVGSQSRDENELAVVCYPPRRSRSDEHERSGARRLTDAGVARIPTTTRERRSLPKPNHRFELGAPKLPFCAVLTSRDAYARQSEVATCATCATCATRHVRHVHLVRHMKLCIPRDSAAADDASTSRWTWFDWIEVDDAEPLTIRHGLAEPSRGDRGLLEGRVESRRRYFTLHIGGGPPVPAQPQRATVSSSSTVVLPCPKHAQ